uniref:TPR_REGION domain-containing protein n=1 Tax=Angiostrongylus cantonensis TaxID=6313 RepID=A0A0K0DQY0_ANGCA
MVTKLTSAESLKDAGNDAMKREQWKEANDCYTDALHLTSDDDKTLRATLYRNRSLSRLKQGDFEGAESDCTKGMR